MLLLYFLSFFLFRVEAGELIIAQSPSSVKFKGDEPIDQHLLPEVFAAAMGFTTQQESDWSGMYIANPFNFAEAVAILYIDGISSLGQFPHFPKYTVNNDEDEYITWKMIRNKITDRYPLENNTLLRIDLSKPGRGSDIETKHLNRSLTEDAEFLNELSNLNSLMDVKKMSDGVPDLYWYTLKSLHSLTDLKGSQHASTLEAKELVFEALRNLASVFDAAYHNQALVVALVSEASHTRRVRSVGNEEPLDFDNIDDNIYDPDFPVIFNIILWFSLALAFSLLAVSVFIASMDPGRDSIIYRMTSNRMKKDS